LEQPHWRVGFVEGRRAGAGGLYRKSSTRSASPTGGPRPYHFQPGTGCETRQPAGAVPLR
jgi:hypothetical protein